MLNWIKGKSDHPLGSEEGINAFLEELNPGRPETVLREIADWLGAPQALSEAMRPEAVLRAVMHLDQAAQTHIGAVWKQFLVLDKIDHLGEQKLKALDDVYLTIVGADRLCLELLAKKPSIGGGTPSAISSTAGLLATRAMRAHIARARIQHTRYRVADTAWWTTNKELIELARSVGVLNLKQRGYPDDPVPSSPWVEVLIGLFFGIAPLGNCNAPQMDLLFRVLRWLEPHFMVSDNFSAHAQYLFNITKSAAPEKVTGPAAPDPNNIYFGPGMAYGHLVHLRTALKASEHLPAWMEDSQCQKSNALAIIDALIMHWSERPPKRVALRKNRESTVFAANGFAQIRRMIAFSDFARSGRKVGYKSHLEMLKFARRGFADVSANEEEEGRWQKATPLETLQILETSGDKQMMDDWSLLDVSDTGIGAKAPFLKPWMVIGAYVGYRLEDEIDWRVGILRRIHRRDTGHPSLGIETLPETPLCAQVRALTLLSSWSPASADAGEIDTHSFEDCIVLSQARSHILIPKGMFLKDGHLVLSVGGHLESVRMVSLIHSNPDCDCIEFATLD